MITERRKILTMLHEHKITVDEAEGLLDAVKQPSEAPPQPEVEIVTADPKVQEALEYARKAAAVNSPVLIIGESGTGKELVARMIHQRSPRRGRLFVPLSCGALSEALVESELFGHERGAFTGAVSRKKGLMEEADGGSLFFDAIDALPLSVQDKLLQFIRTGVFRRQGGTETIQADVRVIAATNKDLAVEVEDGRFLQALFDRMDVVSLVMPPLRERPEDIPLLTIFFLAKYAQGPDGIALEAMKAFMAHNWPGNVRELANVIEHALILSAGETIQVEHLPDALIKK